jgi:peptidylprolyl isomerase
VNRYDLALRANFAPLSVFLVLLLTGSASAVTAGPSPGMTGNLVAQMGAVRFTASDLKEFVARMEPQTRHQAMANPKFMEQLIQAEVARKAVLNEALSKKWQSNPVVAKQIDTAREAIVLKTYLASVTDLPQSYPSDADIKSAYDLNRDKFLVPRQYHLAQIFVSSPPGDKNAAAALQKAKDLAARTHARGARFDELARQNSQHKASAGKGGDIGWLAESQLQPAIRTKIAGMMKGDVSDPIRGDQGWHIVRLIDTKSAALRPLPEVRPVIVAALRQQKQQSDQLQYIKRLVDKMPVQLNQANLNAALKAAR